MTYVIQMDPDLTENKFGGWRGCLWIGPDQKAWYATALAKPTRFEKLYNAELVANVLRLDYPMADIRVSIYEEIFQETIKKVIPEPTVPPKSEISLPNWEWGNDDDMPF